MTGLAEPAGAVAEAVARRSYGRLVALLASRSGDVAGAEDALADAFATALAEWPRIGVPRVPEAWLLVAARRRLADSGRRTATRTAAAAHLRLLADEHADSAAGDGPIPDRRLALMFACAHPAIAAAVRAPLILQTLLGFDAGEIAAAFLVSPAAMGQRLARAKAKIREAGIPLRVPEPAELPERLEVVLSALYAAYGEGWSDATGTDARRRNLASEAIWLARTTLALLPGEPEAMGLLALMLHAEARRPSRRDGDGRFVPLGDQETALWDAAMIREAEALIVRASRAGPLGRFQVEAAIQSVHAARRLTGRTDWDAIATLYDALLGLTASPVVAINRAAALFEAQGPAAGLDALDALDGDARLPDYQPYWAVRARCLARLGRSREAARCYDRAIGLETDESVRAFLLEARSRAVSGG